MLIAISISFAALHNIPRMVGVHGGRGVGAVKRTLITNPINKFISISHSVVEKFMNELLNQFVLL